jgi:hypothetical protein
MIILWRSFEPLQRTRQLASYSELKRVLHTLKNSLQVRNTYELNCFVAASLIQLAKEPFKVIEMREYWRCKRRDIFLILLEFVAPIWCNVSDIMNICIAGNKACRPFAFTLISKWLINASSLRTTEDDHRNINILYKHKAISFCPFVHYANDNFIRKFIEKSLLLSNIEAIDFSGSDHITDSSLQIVASTYPQLQFINISNMKTITTLGVCYIASKYYNTVPCIIVSYYSYYI